MAQAIGVQSRLAWGEISDRAYGNTIGYTGHRFDAETQRYHMRFRVYVPELGRFMQADPAGYVDGMNLYRYAADSPMDKMDPLGLSAGAGNLRDEDLRNMPGVKEYADELAESARETREALEQAGQVLTVVIITAAVMIVPGPDELLWISVVGRGRWLVKAGRGLATLRKLLKGKTPKQEERILRKLYGDPHKVMKGKKVWFNRKTGRSVTIHDEPGHGGPHIHINSRRCKQLIRPKIPLKKPFVPWF